MKSHEKTKTEQIKELLSDLKREVVGLLKDMFSVVSHQIAIGASGLYSYISSLLK